MCLSGKDISCEMPGKFLRKPGDWHKAEHNPKLKSPINVRMKATRYDSHWKKANHNTGIKISWYLSWEILTINCRVPFSENPKC